MHRNVLILMFLTQALTYEQNAYTIKIHHLQKTYVNPKYFNNYYFVYAHYNRTHRAISAKGQLYKEVNSPGFKVLCQVYLGMQKTQKVFAPIRFMVDVCKVLKSNLFGVDLLKTLGNITNCPMKTGVYYVKHFYIDATQYPPNFPAGYYTVRITLFDYKEIMTNASVSYEVIYH